MGILTDAADILASESRPFVPALSASEATGLTLRDALLMAAGCDRVAGPMAYWEWREIHEILASARERLHPHTGAPATVDAEHWANQPSRTLDEVVAALDAGRGEGDIDAPVELTMRPWCNPKVVSTCRVPFVPLAATIQAWTMRGGWDAMVTRYSLTPSTTSWQTLDAVEPDVRDVAQLEGVYGPAMTLRAWMRLQSDTANSTMWLFTVCNESTELPELVDRAEAAIA